jgi:hypothetical protein
MKKYITAILVPCLLIQFTGCFSYQYITFDELKNYNGSNEVRIRTNNQEILIERRGEMLDPMNWELNDSLLVIKTKKQVYQQENYYKLVDKYTEIKLSEIETAELEELDLLKTSAVLLLIGAIIATGIGASQFSTGVGAAEF